MKPLSDLIPILETPKIICITHHYNADADALGSSLGLYHYLQMKGHQVSVICPNSIPDFLQWMPGASELIFFDKQAERTKEVLQNCEILFSLDFNHFSRTKFLAPLLQNCNAVKVMIDHHLMPDLSFDYGLSLPSKSSTCEMVYDFIQAAGDDVLINETIARCLYAGTMTDTGSFRFSSTTSSVHAMVARLMEKGLQTAPIHQAIFDNYRENRLRFMGYVFTDRLEIISDAHAAIIAVSRQDLNRFDINTGDTEGLVNYPLSLKEVVLSIFISEREDEIRMSFRSKGKFDVNVFARNYFEGGGHLNAAGGKSLRSLSETLNKLKQHIQENKNQLQLCYNESF